MANTFFFIHQVLVATHPVYSCTVHIIIQIVAYHLYFNSYQYNQKNFVFEYYL